jgi:hypothetical protein
MNILTLNLFFIPIEQDYDHLDYQRPNGTWKPHYQRMSGNLKADSKKNINID